MNTPKINLKWHALSELIDWEGNETGGLLIGSDDAIEGVWPVPSRRPNPNRYSVQRGIYYKARDTAGRLGIRVWGVIHTHPNGPEGPSAEDIELAKRYRIRAGEVRAVWHPRSGRLTLFDAQGPTASTTIACPLWFRLVRALVFT